MPDPTHVDFGRRSDDYARFRPGFPDSFYDRLEDHLSLDGATAVDLGAPGSFSHVLTATDLVDPDLSQLILDGDFTAQATAGDAVFVSEGIGQRGFAVISGVSGDVRDLEEAADQGNARARLALDVFTSDIRRALGAMLVELGGADAIVFTGGIGENGVNIRAAVCGGLEELGIVLDADANFSARGESKISSPQSRTQIWIVPTNEELIVARQTSQLLEEKR